RRPRLVCLSRSRVRWFVAHRVRLVAHGRHAAREEAYALVGGLVAEHLRGDNLLRLKVYEFARLLQAELDPDVAPPVERVEDYEGARRGFDLSGDCGHRAVEYVINLVA